MKDSTVDVSWALPLLDKKNNKKEIKSSFFK